MTYAEKLKDPRWQKRRLSVLEAAKWACEDCRAKDKELQVHHCVYIKGLEPWEYDISLLMCLCSYCHKHRQDLEDAFRVSIGRISRYTPIGSLEKEIDELLTLVANLDTKRMNEKGWK